MFYRNNKYAVMLHDIEQVFISGSRGGSADRKVQELFLDDLINDRMEPAAVVFYGTSLELTDVRFIKPWIDAMKRVLEREPHLASSIRLRHGMEFPLLAENQQVASSALQDFMRLIQDRLREEYPPETSISPRLDELVRRLDSRCS